MFLNNFSLYLFTLYTCMLVTTIAHALVVNICCILTNLTMCGLWVLLGHAHVRLNLQLKQLIFLMYNKIGGFFTLWGWMI